MTMNSILVMAPATVHICSHSVGMGRNKKYIFRLDVTVDDAPVVAVPELATGSLRVE